MKPRRFVLVLLAACGGAGPQSSAADAPSQPATATPYFPLSVGRTWQYATSRVDGSIGTGCGADGVMHQMTVTSTHVDSGLDVFVRDETHACYSFESSLPYRIDQGNVEVNSDTTTWYLVFQFPPQLGATWAAGGLSGAQYTWDRQVASDTVAAGTFSDCWRRSQVGYDNWEIYCRDVGMVETHWATGDDSRFELQSTSD